MPATNVVTFRPNDFKNLDIHTGYRWVDRDPDLEWICNAITESGMSVGDVIDAIYDASNHRWMPNYRTIDNWLNGKTRRPQNWTLQWVAIALGYERRWVKRPS